MNKSVAIGGARLIAAVAYYERQGVGDLYEEQVPKE